MVLLSEAQMEVARLLMGCGSAGDSPFAGGARGGAAADNLVPLINGGVQLHKLRGIMHDTCATANLAAVFIGELRDISGQLQFGYDDWENKAKDEKPWFDFLCGNHVRNLPTH